MTLIYFVRALFYHPPSFYNNPVQWHYIISYITPKPIYNLLFKKLENNPVIFTDYKDYSVNIPQRRCKMPTVSIIIPTYNRTNMVKEAIQSVLEQTYTDYEIIVVDDGSTDNTRETVTALSDKIIYIYQQNQGRSYARNHGISLAKGDYIAFLDSDDFTCQASWKSRWR